MKLRVLKYLAGSLIGGAILFQAPTCNDLALGVTTVATTVTAGGVIYIITRIIND